MNDTLANEPEASREMLSHHDFVGTFQGIMNRPCMHRTSLCPDKCDHPNEFGQFAVDHYIEHVKPGKYGDEKIEGTRHYGYDMKDKYPGQKEFADLIHTLAVGDKVHIIYDHDYVTRAGNSFPHRPIKKLEKLSEEQAAALCATSAT